MRRHGVTHPRDLRATLGKVSIGNGWGGNSAATTRMLEALQYRGKLRVARREAGIRLYALAESRPRPRAAATRAADVLALLLRLYAPLPEGSLRKLAYMVSGISIPEDIAARVLARMLDGRTVRRVAAGGTHFLLPAGETLDAQSEERVALLAPFDPLVWDRRRFELFWGWDYRFEAYTPPSKRRFGYYALPLLWRDDVIGWANAANVAGRCAWTQASRSRVRAVPRSAARWTPRSRRSRLRSAPPISRSSSHDDERTDAVPGPDADLGLDVACDHVPAGQRGAGSVRVLPVRACRGGARGRMRRPRAARCVSGCAITPIWRGWAC